MHPDEYPILPAAGSPPVEPEPEPEPIAEEPVSNRPAPRQTMSYLRNMLRSHGLEPKNKLGQNFLIDLNLLDLTCRAAELSPTDSVLEVGTGTGSLTSLMGDQAGCVFSVEVDVDMQRIATYFIADRSNVQLFLGDALARKNALNPDMLAGWDALTAKYKATKRKLVANLPYVIATPLISNLLITDANIERMVVMVQWEIAERMQAPVGSKEYNSLSILVQSVADVEIVRKVAPTNFYPKPKVDSAIVLIRPNAEKRAKVGDVQKFRNFLRDLYTHRRKHIRQALSNWPTGHKSKPEIDAKLAELGIDGTMRSEVLDIEQHLRLCAAFGD